MTRRFDDAWREALGLAKQMTGDGFDVVVVRDLLGRASVVVVDKEAPHSPLPILFSADLIGIDVTRHIDWLNQDFVSAAFGPFVQGAADLIVGDTGGGS